MRYIWYPLCYSFLGFCGEVLFARVTGAGKRDRKCHLLLPVCPVYGLGAAAILALPPPVTGHLLPLFAASALLASAAEYALSLFYEKAWGVSFWSYAGMPGNLHGRICPAFSLLWGALGVALVRLVHPLVAGLVERLPPLLDLPALLLFWADFLLTTLLLRRNPSTRTLIWYR